MPRTMLQLRIEALSHHLEQAKDPSVWKQRLHLPAFNVDDRLWYMAVEKIHFVAGELQQALGDLSGKLDAGRVDERDGWRRYTAVRSASEEVFRECLDLLGGLALRDRIQEERICRVADEYIKELSSDTGRRESFAIPGLDVRLFSTLRRVAMVQFPEWSVWTLPLVAHEYGHVVIEESGLKNFALNLTEDAVADEIRRNDRSLKEDGPGIDFGLGVPVLGRADADVEAMLRRIVPDLAAHVGGVDLAKPAAAALEKLLEQAKAVHHRQQQRIRILLADALATLLAGPAYAYAALLLRLNPLPAHVDAASDDERAATILAVLRLMNEPVGAGPPAHGVVVDNLENYWRASVAAARGETVDSAAPQPSRNPAFEPERVREAFRTHIVGHKLALYEAEHSKQAVRWSDAWQSDLGQGMPLAAPALDGNKRLREALNAAWRARIDTTRNIEPLQSAEAEGRVELLEQAALKLCDAIVEFRKRSRNTIDPGGGTDLGRAQRVGWAGGD